MATSATDSDATDPPVIWRPSPDRIEHARMTAFMRWLADERGLQFDDFAGLYQWSVDELDDFWQAVWAFFEVKASQPATAVLGKRTMPGAEWFPGARLNFAENLLDGRDPSSTAIYHASESRALASMTWGELTTLTARIRAGLVDQGVTQGDRVIAYMPNIPEAIAGFLAAASLGATWASCSPDFGFRTLVDRFAQIEPTVLLAVDGYRYGGKDADRLHVVDELRAALPTLKCTVLLGYLNADATLEGAIAWDDFLGPTDAPLEFAQVPFDQPLWVVYSSGTTGLPKAIVHGHGGILLEHLMAGALHLDLGPDDIAFWFTTTGWIMWNIVVGWLALGTTIVLYDGNPGHPDLATLWKLAEDTKMTFFGTSASYIAGCMKADLHPAEGRDLSTLHSLGSTGSPLAPEGFDWLGKELGAELFIGSMSGGTDIAGGFIGGVPLLELRRGELQHAHLGVALAAFDDDGKPLVGEMGELVVTEPMPSMPLYIWGDEDGQRYHDSYFDVYPGVWRHGDWLELSERGSGVIYGRSDSTINRGGIRMGSSEIYRAVLAFDQVLEAMVVDVPKRDTQGYMLLFVVLREGVSLDDGLVKELRTAIRNDCSPRHVPDVVLAVDEVPKTLTGKLLEVPVKRILMGQDPDRVASRDSLANPAALDWYVEYAKTFDA